MEKGRVQCNPIYDLHQVARVALHALLAKSILYTLLGGGKLVIAKYVPPLVNVVAGIAAIALSFLRVLPMPIPEGLAKPLGLGLVAAGMALTLWAFVHLRSGITGAIEPKLDSFVQEGPYRYVRHPVYLGWTLALVGTAVGLRSGAGLLGAVLLYLPSAAWRAKLEEEALARRFGQRWEGYIERTGFLWPRLQRRKR